MPQAIIVRTAWVFSEFGNNFLKTMLRLGTERNSLSIVGDQRGCPTYAGDIAWAIVELINLNAKGGIYHFAVIQRFLGLNSQNSFLKRLCY